MSAAWAYVLLWGVLLAVLAVLQPIFELDGLQFGLAIAAGAVILVLGGLLLARPRHERVRMLPENSYATVLLAIGVIIVAVSLFLPTGLAGVLGLARAWRAQRAA